MTVLTWAGCMGEEETDFRQWQYLSWCMLIRAHHAPCTPIHMHDRHLFKVHARMCSYQEVVESSDWGNSCCVQYSTHELVDRRPRGNDPGEVPTLSSVGGVAVVGMYLTCI